MTAPHPTPEDVRAALAGHHRLVMPALPGRRNHLRAGVLLPLVWAPDPVAIATVRSAALRSHPGEVCFPGGRPDAADADIAATALREAEEELGTGAFELLGRLSSIPLYTSDYRLEPFVARLDPDAALRPSAGEVAAVLRLPLRSLLGRPALEALPFVFETGRAHRAASAPDPDEPTYAPFDLALRGAGGAPPPRRGTLLAPIFRAGGRVMYGGTAFALYELLTVLAPRFGLPVPPLVPARDLTWEDVLPAGA